MKVTCTVIKGRGQWTNFSEWSQRKMYVWKTISHRQISLIWNCTKFFLKILLVMIGRGIWKMHNLRKCNRKAKDTNKNNLKMVRPFFYIVYLKKALTLSSQCFLVTIESFIPIIVFSSFEFPFQILACAWFMLDRNIEMEFEELYLLFENLIIHRLLAKRSYTQLLVPHGF
jgi:hypothetical protein